MKVVTIIHLKFINHAFHWLGDSSAEDASTGVPLNVVCLIVLYHLARIWQVLNIIELKAATVILNSIEGCDHTIVTSW